MITQYLKDLLQDFKDKNPEFNKIKTSVGLTQTLENRKNFADLPLILIENINFSSDDLLTGTLSFDIMYFDIDKKYNGYEKLEQDFLEKFINYIKNYVCEINITNIEFEISDTDNEFGVIVSCDTVYTI